MVALLFSANKYQFVTIKTYYALCLNVSKRPYGHLKIFLVDDIWNCLKKTLFMTQIICILNIGGHWGPERHNLEI